MLPRTTSHFDELVLERNRDDAFLCSSPGEKPIFKTDLQFSDYVESPPLPGTPVIPLLKLGEFEPFELEEDLLLSPKKSSPIKNLIQIDSLPTLPSKGGGERDEALSSGKTFNCSTMCTDTRLEDSEEEGVFFAPLSNKGIKVWMMDDKPNNMHPHLFPELRNRGSFSQRGTTIFEILKAKKQARPRLGTN
jgi:hypothetical protein